LKTIVVNHLPPPSPPSPLQTPAKVELMLAWYRDVIVIHDGASISRALRFDSIPSDAPHAAAAAAVIVSLAHSI